MLREGKRLASHKHQAVTPIKRSFFITPVRISAARFRVRGTWLVILVADLDPVVPIVSCLDGGPHISAWEESAPFLGKKVPCFVE